MRGQLYAPNPRLTQETVRRLDAAGDALGRWAGAFQSRLAFVLPAEGHSSGGEQTTAWQKLRQSQALYPALSLRRPQPARIMRHEAECPGGNPWRAETDSLQLAGARRLRASAPHGQGHGPRHGRAVDDARVSNPRRGLCLDRRPANRHPDGAEPARFAALAIRRLRHGLPGQKRQAEAPARPSAGQYSFAVSL